MEGLLIAEQLRALRALLPAERLAWRFPDDRTAVLPLTQGSSLWIGSRPPRPFLELRQGAPVSAAAKTPFQLQLAARVSGPLVGVGQERLDRVARFEFGAGEGFVPEPALELVAELTGRNANLVLLAQDGTVVGVERLVALEQNRYRQLRPGLSYRPPPPQAKLDPLTAGRAALEAALAGKRLAEVRQIVDGIGPELAAALAAMTGLPMTQTLAGESLESVLTALATMARTPGSALRRHGSAAATDAGTSAGAAQAKRLAELRKAVDAKLGIAGKRLADARRALAEVTRAPALRAEADLLLANAAEVGSGQGEITLPGFAGEAVTMSLDPRLDAVGNAAARYQKAKRLAGRAKRAREVMGELERESFELEALSHQVAELAAVVGATGVPRAGLDAEAQRLTGLLTALGRGGPGSEGEGHASASGGPGKAAGGRSKAALALPGVRFVDPRGFEVLVGRNARENDALTFKVAKSRDLWLHAQGFSGGHVIVRTGGRELPFDTVLFAARLAAGFSRGRGAGEVPVDYTQRKNVWRVKGGAPGAVHISHHKTVYVTPARDDAAASGAVS